MVEMLKKENERNASMPGVGGGKKLTDEQLRQIVLKTQRSMGSSYLGEIDQDHHWNSLCPVCDGGTDRSKHKKLRR